MWFKLKIQFKISISLFAARSSTYVNYNSTVHSEYTVGSWTGELASEVVSSPWIPGGPIRVDVVAITESHQVFHRYHPMQGILGLAYKTGAKVGVFMC